MEIPEICVTNLSKCIQKAEIVALQKARKLQPRDNWAVQKYVEHHEGGPEARKLADNGLNMM